MNPRHFLRMAHWARNPPSARRVALILGIITVCLALAGLEWSGVLPDGFGLSSGDNKLKIKPLP
ncbi:hypothetical protein QKW60_13025 [Defluviimonas aestuarii]|uniref:hypothetical protein n=1 Tax=Albidovulum aestuarii TaxID=1130726 RepID=UPI00249A8EE5|nr:hypothetical protein [Defluviimonas aestuarii]MDI3337335.1 hypothetical protein [Defluviimonas aestuarii]